LDREKYKRITGGVLDKVLYAIAKTIEHGIPLKLNAVVSSLFEESDALALASLARDNPISVRFIELMPIGPRNMAGVSGDALFELFNREFGKLAQIENRIGSGPASCYQAPGFKGSLGFINAMSHAFCNSCNRIRLSPDGHLISCLAGGNSVDVKSMLRSGADNKTLENAIRKAVSGKPKMHGFTSEDFNGGNHKPGMHRIGG
jgi:cyclic pyranopterin phosphate synthase